MSRIRNVEFGIRKTDLDPFSDGWVGEFSIFNLEFEMGGRGFFDFRLLEIDGHGDGDEQRSDGQELQK